MRIRLLLLILLFSAFLLFLNIKLSHAECILDCIFQAGTKCINNECVNVFNPSPTPIPTPTPAPINEIRLESRPKALITATVLDCSKMDLSKLRIYLTRKQPPGPVSYYSDIFWFEPDFMIRYYFARKDLLNRYVFVEADNPVAQFTGEDFNFTTWEDTAFGDFLKSKTCVELKAGGYYFQYGIGKDSFQEGGIWTFR